MEIDNFKTLKLDVFLEHLDAWSAYVKAFDAEVIVTSNETGEELAAVVDTAKITEIFKGIQYAENHPELRHKLPADFKFLRHPWRHYLSDMDAPGLGEAIERLKEDPQGSRIICHVDEEGNTFDLCEILNPEYYLLIQKYSHLRHHVPESYQEN